ncbi:arylsulfatase [Mycolicibacterium moriokaense]|nr:arylsulfatase [Mycolicibacterium moriokaense]
MSAHPDPADRSALPIADRVPDGSVTFDAKDPETSFPPIVPLRPPAKAPNVLVVLLDDVGFGAPSAFGGPVNMPTAERLAAGGLKYTRFHTTALCSPTRSALLTGRNHHSVGFGSVAETATSAPGYNSIRPNTAAPFPEVLRLNGYSTAQFGKCHEVPPWETSPLGPFDHWPTGSGFEHFYGFIGGDTNQWAPVLYEDTVPIEPPDEPGYHLSEDLATKASHWIRQQKALMPDKPFFVYFAPGAAHAPHHVPKEWADKYEGAFDDGWDALRERTFARQKELGVIPADAELTDRHVEIPAWDAMPDVLKPVLRRQMEVYAGFLEHVDSHVGRVIDTLAELGVLDDTLIYYITGDNGASAEGQPNGTFSEVLIANGLATLETPEYLASKIDEWGGPTAFNHYAIGWAHATNTPYQWTKQVASHWGGTRNGTIVHWPNGFGARGETRDQFHHVIDVAPTILEAAGLPQPLTVHGVQQKPIEGTSMTYTFEDSRAAERRETQYFEMFGNRGIYHKGWTAVTKHRTPWEVGAVELPAFDDDVWELYAPDDWTQARNRAADMPDKLAELQRLWLIEAVKYHVLPLDDRTVERFNAELAGRPQLITGNSQLLFGGMRRLTENSVINVKNKSHSVTAEVQIPDGGAEGVIVCQGASFGGWSLYVAENSPRYCYNFCDMARFVITGEKTLLPGTRQVRMEFAYDGGVGGGGAVTLYLDGEAIGHGRVDRTMAFLFSFDETLDVGCDLGTPVSSDYPARGNDFTGRVNWVQIDVDAAAADADHFIGPHERMTIAMLRH